MTDRTVQQAAGQDVLRGTAVAIDGVGVLLRGPSGAGKSDLALRLIDGGAHLISDDYVMAHRHRGVLTLDPAPAIEGALEVRGYGLIDVAAVGGVPLRLVVDLKAAADIERLPDPRTCTLMGTDVPCLDLAPWEPSAAAKLRMIVAAMARAGREADR